MRSEGPRRSRSARGSGDRGRPRRPEFRRPAARTGRISGPASTSPRNSGGRPRPVCREVRASARPSKSAHHRPRRRFSQMATSLFPPYSRESAHITSPCLAKVKMQRYSSLERSRSVCTLTRGPILGVVNHRPLSRGDKPLDPENQRIALLPDLHRPRGQAQLGPEEPLCQLGKASPHLLPLRGQSLPSWRGPRHKKAGGDL